MLARGIRSLLCALPWLTTSPADGAADYEGYIAVIGTKYSCSHGGTRKDEVSLGKRIGSSLVGCFWRRQSADYDSWTL